MFSCARRFRTSCSTPHHLLFGIGAFANVSHAMTSGPSPPSRAKTLRSLRQSLPKNVKAFSCALTPLKFWQVTTSEEYSKHIAQLDGNERTVISASETTDETGEVVYERVTRYTPAENPIPASLRSYIGCETLSFEMREKWWKNLCDAAHPSTYESIPNVLADRISIRGSCWAEPNPSNANGSLIFFRNDVKVNIAFVGERLARGIAAGSNKALGQTSKRAEDFAAASIGGSPSLSRSTTGRSVTRLLGNSRSSATLMGKKQQTIHELLATAVIDATRDEMKRAGIHAHDTTKSRNRGCLRWPFSCGCLSSSQPSPSSPVRRNLSSEFKKTVV